MESPSSFDTMMSSLKKRGPQKSSHDQMMDTLKAREAKKKADERAGWTAAARKRDKSLQDRRDVEAHITEFAETAPLHENDLEEVESMEVMTAPEMFDALKKKMGEVSESIRGLVKESEGLQAEAKEFKKTGVLVDTDLQARIESLIKKHAALTKLYETVVTENLWNAYDATASGEELLIPKPAEWAALMDDEDQYVELKQSMVKHPSSIELQMKQAKMKEDAEITENYVSDQIDMINAQARLKEASSKQQLIVNAFDFEENQRPGIEGHMRDVYAGMRKQHQNLRDIEMNLGMVRRLEG